AYVPYRSLISREQYASMFGPGTNPDSIPTTTTGNVGTGGVATRDTAATGGAAQPADGAPNGGPDGGRRGRRQP
ncbi:MAG: hypothetical protein H7X80_09860, partial [bacterium]|nr:hypothetical protein [Candidatus Kapabacteria bacterium]